MPPPSPAAAPGARLSGADRAAAHARLDDARGRLVGVPGFNELIEQSLRSTGMVGQNEREVSALRERAQGFLRAHRESVRLCGKALAPLRAAYPEPGAAPFEDLALFSQLVEIELISTIQVARSEWLIGRLKSADVSAFGLLYDELCYPLALMSPLNELADMASAAAALAVRREIAAPEHALRVLWTFHRVANYFSTFKVCNLPDGEVTARVRKRLEQWPGYPESADGRTARAAVVRVWEMGMAGGGARARRELPACVEAVEALARILGGDPALKNELIDRVKGSAGGK